MLIKEDKSYLTTTDKKAIEQGIAVLAVHSIRLDRHYTEEEKKQNLQQAQKMSSEEYNKMVRATACKLGERHKVALDALEQSGLVLGQYHHPADLNTDYDLWFWCNCRTEYKTDDDPNGRDLSYVTLSLNSERRTLEQCNTIVETAIEVLKKIEAVNSVAIIQYEAIYYKDKLREAATAFAESCAGKFVNYGFEVGKIVKIDPEYNGGYEYGFKKKHAKTSGYCLSMQELYSISLDYQGA